jgi:hypothetical protein
MFLTELGKYFTVYATSMLKFIAGPTIGAAIGLTFMETLILTVLGMMTTVIVIAYFGKKIREWYLLKFGKKRKLFTKRNRRFVYIWRNYGIIGVSFLTPLIFSPPIGALLVTSVGSPKKKIILYMFASAVFWGIAYSKFLHILVNLKFI